MTKMFLDYRRQQIDIVSGVDIVFTKEDLEELLKGGTKTIQQRTPDGSLFSIRVIREE